MNFWTFWNYRITELIGTKLQSPFHRSHEIYAKVGSGHANFCSTANFKSWVYSMPSQLLYNLYIYVCVYMCIYMYVCNDYIIVLTKVNY